MSEPTPPALRPDYQMVGPPEDEAAPPTPFRLQRLLPTLLKFWWVPLVTLAVSVAAAGGYVWFKPPVYVSRGQMWETLKLRLPEGSLFTEDMQNFLGTQTELLQSTPLRNLALALLKSSTSNGPALLEKDDEPHVAIRVAQASKSSVFTLEATSSRADYTQAYLNALMRVYVEYKKNVRKEVSFDTLNSISSEVDRANRELKANQDLLTAYQQTNSLAMEEEGRARGSYLASLRTQLAEALLNNRLLQGTFDRDPEISLETNSIPAVIEIAPTNDLPAVGAVVPPEQNTAAKEIELLKMQRQKLSFNLRPKHPKIARLDADIEHREKIMEFFRNQSRDQLAAARQANQLRVEALKASIKEWEAKVAESSKRFAEVERIRFNMQRSQSEYDRLEMLLRNVDLSRNIDQETLRILEPASPAKRSHTKDVGLLAGAGVGGLGLSLAILVLIALRDDRFSSPFEVNEKLGESIVGQVPEVFSPSPETSLPLLEINDPRHAYAESFRSLRSALIFMATESERPQVVLITSAVPHEGKSTIAANLARALALGGSRVALVDGDLRRGVLHEFMHLQRGPGLAEVLRDPSCLDDVIQTNSLANLAFISSGNCSGNCGDALLGPAFDQVLARLRAQFDYVVIDSSPVFAADDATTLAPKVDGTLFVVRSRFSRTGPVRDALGLLYQRQARVLGVIFNQADSSQRNNYYKYARTITRRANPPERIA